MPRVWRITRSRYASRALDGEGARLHGSRWTSPGLRVVHASATLSLATLEILVHLQDSATLASYSFFSLDLSGRPAEKVGSASLPGDWRRFPAPVELRKIGDAWAERQRSLALQVPSAVIPHERNYLINPRHPDFPELALQGPSALDIDPRVFRT